MDNRELDRLTNKYFYLAERAAATQKKKNRYIDFDDMLGYLSICLVKSIKKLDPNRAETQVNYLSSSLKGHALNYLRDRQGVIQVSRKDSDLYLKYKKLAKTQEFLSADSEHQARMLGTTPELVQDMLTAMRARLPIAIEHAPQLRCEYSATDTKTEALHSLKENQVAYLIAWHQKGMPEDAMADYLCELVREAEANTIRA